MAMNMMRPGLRLLLLATSSAPMQAFGDFCFFDEAPLSHGRTLSRRGCGHGGGFRGGGGGGFRSRGGFLLPVVRRQDITRPR